MWLTTPPCLSQNRAAREDIETLLLLQLVNHKDTTTPGGEWWVVGQMEWRARHAASRSHAFSLALLGKAGGAACLAKPFASVPMILARFWNSSPSDVMPRNTFPASASTAAAEEVKQPIASCADDVFQKRACGRLEEGLASAEGQTGIVAEP